MKRLLLVFACCFLVACGQNYVDFNPYQGSEGVEPSFLSTMETEVYEGMTLPLTVRLWNRGAHHLNYTDLIFRLTGDQFYVEIEQDPALEPEFLWLADDTILVGKDEGWHNGEWVDLNPLVTFKPVQGLRETPDTQISGTVCYPYVTYFADQVCVDSNAYNGNVQYQVCDAQMLSYQDQGAPVAVTRVENRPSPRRMSSSGGKGYIDIVQPVFIIHVANVGNGAVVAPEPQNRYDLTEFCAGRVPKDVDNAVLLDARLSNHSLDCRPNPVRLRDGAAYVTCALNYSDDLPLSAPNYLATLTVGLSYVYETGVSADFGIIRSPDFDLTYKERDEWEERYEAGYINGVTMCEYCSEHHGDSRCDWPEKAITNESFTCACGSRECQRLWPMGKCVFGDTWCPGSGECCIPQVR